MWELAHAATTFLEYIQNIIDLLKGVLYRLRPALSTVQPALSADDCGDYALHPFHFSLRQLNYAEDDLTHAEVLQVSHHCEVRIYPFAPSLKDTRQQSVLP